MAGFRWPVSGGGRSLGLAGVASGAVRWAALFLPTARFSPGLAADRRTFEPVARLRLLVQTALVLTLAVSTQGLLVAQGAWLTNQDWIAETLCVNPETDCDGKCQLADRMERMHGMHGDHDASHGPATTPLLELALSVRAHVAARATLAEPSARSASAPMAGPTTNTGREAARGVFHPPRQA